MKKSLLGFFIQKRLSTFSQNAEQKIGPSLLTNHKVFDIICSCKHWNAFVRGNKIPENRLQRVFVRCENISVSEYNSSPEQFRWKRLPVNENGSLPLQRSRVENDVDKRITFRYQKEWYRGLVITSSLLRRIASSKGDFLFLLTDVRIPRKSHNAKERHGHIYERIRKIYQTVFPRWIFLRLDEENISWESADLVQRWPARR